MLSVESFDSFIESCKEEKRSVNEQVLNFDKKRNLTLLQLLIENYKPEHRYYRYKFFTDNCSTRIRDIIVLSSGDEDLLRKPKVEANNTFRQLYTRYLKSMPWSRFGIDLVLGILTDNKAGYDALFIPDFLEKSIELAKIENKPLILEEKTLVVFNQNDAANNLFSPSFIMIFLLLSAIFIQFRKKWIKIYDNVFFLLFGLLGLFITILSIFSKHAELQNNLVIVFLLPANIILPFLKPTFRKYYCIIVCVVITLGLILMPLLPQKFNFAFILLILAIGTRIFFNILKPVNQE